MTQLLLRFHESNLSIFDWAVMDNIESIPFDWSLADLSDLPELREKYSVPVVIILPQECIYLTEFELPQKASRQVLASIEYQIEDQLAQDTESQHFAVGVQTGDKIPIVVVDQDIMQACQSLQEKYGLRVVQIIPELYLCPSVKDSGEVNIIESHDGFILRYGETKGLKCKRELLKSMLTMIHREHVINRVNYYLGSEIDFEDLRVDKFESTYQPAIQIASQLNSSHVINLQQRQFQASSQWNRLFKAWKSVVAVLVVLVTITVFSRVMALQKMESDLEAIKMSQYELVKDYLDSNIKHTDNLKKALIKRLQGQGNGQESLGFLSLLVEFSQARSKFPSIAIIKVGYQQSRLSIDINSTQLNDVEALHAALNARGLSTRLERLNIKPELVSGQFIIEANSNG